MTEKSENTSHSLFWEIHSGLPREGPGDKASTQQAYRLATELPAHPAILDIGCGPGQQTMDLAEISQGQITAVDTHGPFLTELTRRAAEADQGSRIHPLQASMFDLPFAAESFDLIWCEGAMYFLGFEAALKQWKRLLKPGGYLAVTEPCWLKHDLPEVVKTFWAEYPAMADIPSCLKRIQVHGYREVGHFVLPDAAWWEDYYTPKLARIQQLRQKYADQPALMAQLDEAEQETVLHKAYGDHYGYVFFVMQKCQRMSHNKMSQGPSASLQRGIKTTCLSGLWAVGMWLLFALLMVLNSEKMLPWSPYLPRLNTIWAPTGAFFTAFSFFIAFAQPSSFSRKSKGPLRSFRLKSALMALVLALGIPLTEEAYLGNSRESSSKANAHTLQTMLETYAIAQGQYPDSIQTLKIAASQPMHPYWKELTNPYFRSSGIFQSSQPADAVLRVTDAIQVGAVVYQPLQNPQGKITGYRIFVYDRQGKRLKLQQNNQMIPFELSNS